MAVYNIPQIQILNSDNLVYRDTPYSLQFKITKPTLSENITEDVNYTNQVVLDDTHKEFTYPLNQKEWEFTDGSVDITSMEISGENEDVLQVTGKKLLNYKYKVYFNNEIKKEISTPITNEEVTDTLEIVDSMFNDFVDGIVKIEVYYGYDENLIETKEHNLQLVNTSPNIIIGDVVNNKVDVMITDNEKDEIQINIKLNGKDYFPTGGGFTSLINTPYFYTAIIPSDKININPHDFVTPNNILTVTVKDKYGSETQLHKSFVGEFYGLLFVDEEGNFYSTDSNDYTDDKNILQELYLGNIKAGTQGEKKLVYLQNKSRNVLTNIKLILNTVGIPDKTYVRISKSSLDNFSVMTNEIDFGTQQLGINEKIGFYIQGNTEILSLGGGYGYIDVIADAIE